jgi:hypothetical protein
MYRISFKAQAVSNRSATFYAGKASDPWNAYSGYNGINISATETFFTFSFTMTNPTDPAARLVFDFGTNIAGVSVTEIKVEELTTTVTAVEEKTVPVLSAYPNPVKSVIHIDNLDSYSEATVHDTRGQRHLKVSITPGTKVLNLDAIPPGFYVLGLIGNGRHDYLKVVKE